MDSGEWQLTHQGIAFDKDGNLLDGQHRLQAVINHGRGVEFMVTRNLPHEVFSSLDRGVVRTLADTTKLPQRRVEVLNILHMTWKHASLAYKSTPIEIIAVNEVFQSACEEFEARCSTVRRITTQAPIRAAAVLCLQEGDHSVIAKYKAMAALEFDLMPPAVQALVKQLMRMSSNGSCTSRESIFVRSLTAFDPSLGESTKIKISDLGLLMQRAQNRIADLLQSSPPPRHDTKAL